jgi:hypothetical protein
MGRPFCCNDFNFGSAGTFATQGLVNCPPKRIWHVAQSPLIFQTRAFRRLGIDTGNKGTSLRHKNTYLLQEYFGLIPSFATAALSGVPGLKSIFLPPYVKMVIWSEESHLPTLGLRKALALFKVAKNKAKAKTTTALIMIGCYVDN